MARVNKEHDIKMAEQGLLRLSVVAKLLDVAPKTVHAWKNFSVTLVNNVKYLTWTDVHAARPEATEKSLPANAGDAHALWSGPIAVAAESVVNTAVQLAVDEAAAVIETAKQIAGVAEQP